MIPLAVPNLSGNEAKYLQDCVSSTFVSSVGPFVTRLEDMVSNSSGSKKSVATSSGTTGLHAALTALGVGKQDLVILPSFTFIGSANAISHCGAMPWLVDIDPETWTIDPNKLQNSLSKSTIKKNGVLVHKPTGLKVAAIMPVHVLGIPVDMESIVSIAKQYNLPIVADGAAALGTIYKGKKIGELGAELTVFSFNGNKTVTAGGGGVVSGNDESLVQSVFHLTTTARVGSDYDFDRIGFNYRLTNIQAAVGCAQMEKLDEFVAAKRRIQKLYTKELTSITGISAFPDPSYGESACWFSGVVIDQNIHRPITEIRSILRQKEIDARPFWKPIHLQLPYKDCPTESMEATENVWPNILTLPCSSSLSIEDQTTVINEVRKILT
jgi:perosamine synthetase